MYMKSMLYFLSAVFANCSLVHNQSTEAHFFKADRITTRVCFIIENRTVLQKYAMRGRVHARAQATDPLVGRSILISYSELIEPSHVNVSLMTNRRILSQLSFSIFAFSIGETENGGKCVGRN